MKAMRHRLPFDLVKPQRTYEMVVPTPDGQRMRTAEECAALDARDAQREREARWPLSAFVRAPGVAPLKLEE